MATQPEWGKNRHNRLLEDGQALAGRHMRTLGQMVDEVGVQVTQSRPRLDKVATLLAKATKEGARMEALLAELQSLVAGMKARGVLIKNMSAAHPLLHNCLRITISTPQENAAMLAALFASLSV